MAFATTDDWLIRLDERTLGDLASDTETPVARKDFSVDAVLLGLLDDASGEVESALIAADMYSDLDLSTLTGNSLARLKRLTCDIASVMLFERRPEYNTERGAEKREKVEEQLARLRKGLNIFNLDAPGTAGKPSHSAPTIAQIREGNFIRDEASPAYPRRRVGRSS